MIIIIINHKVWIFGVGYLELWKYSIAGKSGLRSIEVVNAILESTQSKKSVKIS